MNLLKLFSELARLISLDKRNRTVICQYFSCVMFRVWNCERLVFCFFFLPVRSLQVHQYIKPMLSRYVKMISSNINSQEISHYLQHCMEHIP